MHRDLLFQCYNTILQYSSHRPWPFEDTPHTTYNTHGRIAFGFLIYCYTYTYFNLVNNSEVFKWWWIFISAGSVQKPFNTSGDDGTKNQGKAPHSHINAWSPQTQPYIVHYIKLCNLNYNERLFYVPSVSRQGPVWKWCNFSKYCL